jgi:uncharacterized protein (DUF1330 family)
MIQRRLPFIASLLVIAAIAFAAKAFSARVVTPKAYGIAEINVTDPNAYKQYLAAVSPIVAEFQGRYLVRAGTIVPVEGDAPTGRYVVIEFPSLAKAKSFEASPEYLAIDPLRQRASHSRIFLVEGFPQP